MFVITAKRNKPSPFSGSKGNWEYAQPNVYTDGYPTFGTLEDARVFSSPEEAKSWFEENKKYLKDRLENSFDLKTISVMEIVFLKTDSLHL